MKTLALKWEALLSLLGTLMLFISWLTQQFLFEKWNSRLARIEGARAAFQTYQSNNALFNAIYEITPDDRRSTLRQLQIRNYRLGLQELRESLSSERMQALQGEIERLTKEHASLGPDLAEIQGELEAIQTEHTTEANDIRKKKRTWQVVFGCLYGIGTVFLIAGSVIKAYSGKD